MIGKTRDSSQRRAAIRAVTGSNFTPLVLAGKGRVVVEFISYGCAHCRVIERIPQPIADIAQPEETLFRVNVAIEQELAASYEIEGTQLF